MDKNIGKAIQRVVQNKKYIKRIEQVDVVEYQNYLIGEIIRYVIIFKDDNLLEDYIIKLIKAMDANKNIAELNMIRDTTYASKIVSMITKRKRKITQEELNEKVFDYMYKNLITYGYVFHAFNHKLSSSITKYGLDVTKKSWEDIKIEQIENILKKYGIIEPFADYKLFSKEGLAFTSNFNKIYAYAKNSPSFLSNLIMNTKDPRASVAIYNKDIVEIKDIVIKFLEKNDVAEEDKEIIMLFLEENLEYFFNEKNVPVVALVERNSIEFLKGMYISYSKYLETTSEMDADEYSIVSYILNIQDNFNDFRLKDKIKFEDVMLVNLPEYKANSTLESIKKEEKNIEENIEIVENINTNNKKEKIKLEENNKKVVHIKGDILFGYVEVKTSLNKIKDNYFSKNNIKEELVEEVKEEENKEEEYTLSFTSLKDKKEEPKEEENNEEEYTLSFTSLKDKKEKPKKEKNNKYENTFTLDLDEIDNNGKKDTNKFTLEIKEDIVEEQNNVEEIKEKDTQIVEENNIEIIEEEKQEEISKEKEDLMNNFANIDDCKIDILGEIEKRIQDSLEKEEQEKTTANEEQEIEEKSKIDEINEENDVEEIEEIEENVEQPKEEKKIEEVVVEKVVVEKITKKYKVQSKKVKIKKKGEPSSKEKIDKALERAYLRKQEEENLKLENEALLKKELANIEKFALEIINEISEKVEKEVEIVKNTKIFKDNMTKEELDEFNQNVINKICASNIDEEVIENKIKEYNPIEEYEKKIANMNFDNSDFEIENEYDPIAEYEKQLELQKQSESMYKEKIDELFAKEDETEEEDKFGKTIELPLDKIKEELEKSKEIIEETPKIEETNVEILEVEDEEPDTIVLEELPVENNLEKEEIKEEVKETIIPITLLKENVETENHIIKEENDNILQEDNIEEEQDFDELLEQEDIIEVEETLDDEKEVKYKGLNIPKFNKTELKPETKKVIEKIKEKALGLITNKEENEDIIEESNETFVEDINEEIVIPEEKNTEENKTIETKKTNSENYRELAVCNTDDIDVSMYLNNVISNRVYENTDEEEKEKQEVIDKLLEETKPIKEEVELDNIESIDNIENAENIENIEENLDQEVEAINLNEEPIEELKIEKVENINTESVNNEEYKNEEENSIETLEENETKNELSEEEILKLIQEDELYMDDPDYISKEKGNNKYKDIIPNDMETSLIVKTTLMESFKLALKDFTRKIASSFTTSLDAEEYENKVSRSQRIRRSPRLNEFSTYNDYKKTNKIDRVVNLMEDKSLRERRPRMSKEQKNEMIRNEKESFIENLYKEINTNSIKKSMYNNK